MKDQKPQENDRRADFRAALSREVIATIQKNRRAGVTAMAVDNLIQCARVPAGAPVGTNAAYYYRESFREVVRELPRAYQADVMKEAA